MKLKTLTLLVLLLLAVVPPALAQEPAIVYERYDVDIQLHASGDFTVREIQQVRFNGVYRTAFAEIPLDYTTGIDNVLVWIDEKPANLRSSASSPGDYAVSQDGQNLYVDWRYTETEPGDVRTFIVQYDVSGGLWVYPNETVLEWRAVPGDRNGFPVLNSRVTVTLPEAVEPGELRYTAYGPEFEAEASRERVTWSAGEALADGTHFQVRLGLPAGLTAATVQPWQAAEDAARLEYRLEAIDVALVIGADGRVRVSEQQRVSVLAGAMVEGRRSLQLAALDGLSQVAVFEGEQRFSPDSPGCEAYCFKIEETPRSDWWAYYDDDQREVVVDNHQAGQVDLRWLFPALVKGESTTFRLEYEAEGVMQVLPDGQRLDWTVVFNHHPAPVETASLEVTLPPGVTWEQVTVAGGELVRGPDGVGRLLNETPLQPGSTWQVSLTLPAGATGAAKPAWQQQLEAAQAEARQAETRRARLAVGAGAGAALLLVAGLLAVYVAWRQWGRDRAAVTGLEYLNRPPSDLPPGIVAYLVDEEPTAKGALAALFHLANLGLLRLDMSDAWLRLQRNYEYKLVEGQTIQTLAGDTVTVPGHLVTLFNDLRDRIPHTESVALTSIAADFQAALPGVYVDMAAEAQHLFTGRPETVRHRWLSRGQWLVLAGLVLAAAAWYFYLDQIGWIAMAPPVALALVGLAMMGASRWMPQRSPAGVEEAARWRAFERYLRQLQAFGSQAEAQAILDRYFAYAVALNVDETVLAQAEALGAATPAWTQPVWVETAGPDSSTPRENRQDRRRADPQPPRPLRAVWGRPAGKKDKPAAKSTAAPARPSLQGLSGQLGQTLAKASANIGEVLNAAVADSQDDTPFKLILKGAGATAEATWKATTSTAEVIGDILEALPSSSGGGSGGYSSGSGGWSSGSSSGSSWSSSSSSRSSSSRRSGGGGSRGFG